MKKVIGLTGGIAAGKSTVSNYLKEQGYRLIDADIIAREIAAKGTVALARIVQAFGAEYLNTRGELDRAKLGAHVFGDSRELAKLNAITLPLIKEEIERRVAASDEPIIFVDGATIIESGLTEMFDQIWLVGTDADVQLERLRQRDGFSAAEAQKRIQSQLPLSEKKKNAQVYLDNNGSIEQTYSQIRDALAALVAE